MLPIDEYSDKTNTFHCITVPMCRTCASNISIFCTLQTAFKFDIYISWAFLIYLYWPFEPIIMSSSLMKHGLLEILTIDVLMAMVKFFQSLPRYVVVTNIGLLITDGMVVIEVYEFLPSVYERYVSMINQITITNEQVCWPLALNCIVWRCIMTLVISKYQNLIPDIDYLY